MTDGGKAISSFTIKNAPYYKVRFDRYDLEFSARLVSHVVNRSFHFVVAQACVTAFCRHGLEAFERMFVQGFFTLFDTRRPIVIFAYNRSAGNGTAVTHLTVGFENSFTVCFGRRSIRFLFRFGFDSRRFSLLFRFGFGRGRFCCRSCRFWSGRSSGTGG